MRVDSPFATESAEPRSPCSGVCRMDDGGLCLGCRRTLDEIAAWSGLDGAARRAIWRALPERGGPALPTT